MGYYNVASIDLFELHVVPQDNGNHSDTRWLALDSEKGNMGLFVTMPEPFNFSIYNYTDDNLTAARRINQLESEDFYTVNIDYKQAPIGTATCGPGVNEKYVLKNQVYEYTVLLRAFDKSHDPIELSRFQVPDVKNMMMPTPEIKVENKGNEDFRIFNEPLTITLGCAEQKAEIRFTLDGSEPDEKSALYKKPFTIDKSCTLKVKAFMKGKEPSYTTVRCFDYHPIKNTTFGTPPVERYGKNADIALMDGKKGSAGDYYNDWLGFNGNDMEATIELSKPLDFSVVKVGVCHEPNDWVMWPKAVWVSFSSDGTSFSEWKLAELPVFVLPDKMMGHGRIEARARVNAKDIRFISIKVESYGALPDWHPYAGQKVWIMVDEVTIE